MRKRKKTKEGGVRSCNYSPAICTCTKTRVAIGKYLYKYLKTKYIQALAFPGTLSLMNMDGIMAHRRKFHLELNTEHSNGKAQMQKIYFLTNNSRIFHTDAKDIFSH